jgi:hypothetical protein
MKKPKKITVKHYLNTNLKSTNEGFLVYVQITVNRTTDRKPSQIKARFKDLETLRKIAENEIQKERIKIEKSIVKELFKNNNFSFRVSKTENVKRKKSIIRTLQRQLKKHQKELLELEQYNLF